MNKKTGGMMSDNTLRTAIARALFESDLEVWPEFTSEHEWSTVEPGYLTQADAVLAVLADPPSDVIERAAVDFKQAWHEADNESRQGERVTAGLRAAFRAAFDPPAVIQLLDRIAELEAEVRTLETARLGDLELVCSYRNIADSSDRYRKRQVELTVAQAKRAEDAEGGRDKLLAKLAQVRALHRRHGTRESSQCVRCEQEWPCDTIEILDGESDE